MAQKQSTNQPVQQYGWTCPKCGNSYAPTVQQCPVCAMNAEKPLFPNHWRPKRRPGPWPYTPPWEPWEQEDYRFWQDNAKKPWERPIVRIAN